jgi:hypothetical protein
MSAVYVNNLIINAGTDFKQTFILDDFIANSKFNLSKYNVISQMRKWYGSSNYIDLHTEILDPSVGIIMISLTPEETKLIPPGRYNYDVVMVSPLGFATRVIEGITSVKEGVTRQ